MAEEKFKQYKNRLNSLDEVVQRCALEYAEKLVEEENSTEEEAIERGITKAEMEYRNL